MANFTDLDCWKACRKIVQQVSGLCKTLPKNEFELKSNMTRAARSSTRNIAEGYGRFHYQENIQFLRISRGSLTEVMDDFITCKDEGYINKETFNKLNSLTEKGIQLINGYIRYLKKKQDEK